MSPLFAFRKTAAALISAAILSPNPAVAQDRLEGRKRTEEKPTDIEADLETLPESAPTDALRKDVEAVQAEVASLRQEAERDRREANQLRESLAEMAEETAALKAAAARLETEVAEHRTDPPAGYKKGFFVQSPKGRLRLMLNGHVRPRYTAAWRRRYETDETGSPLQPASQTAPIQVFEGNDFGLDGARIQATVRILERVRGVLSLDFVPPASKDMLPVPAAVRFTEAASPEHSTARPVYFSDAYGALRVFDALSFTAGQFKVPFDLETGFDEADLLFGQSSLMTRPYYVYADDPEFSSQNEYFRTAYDIDRGASFGRDIGLGISGTALDDRFAYNIGVFNGAGLNRENDNRDVLVSGRLSLSPFGPVSGSVSGAENAAETRLTVGLGAAYDLKSHAAPQAQNSRYNAAEISTTADVRVERGGLSAFASFFYRRQDHGTGRSVAPQVLTSLGTAVQVGYYLERIRLEPTLRYSYAVARLDRSGSGVNEITAGLFHALVPGYVRIGIAYTGLLPIDKEGSYLSPLGVRCDTRHELAANATVRF